MLWLWRRLAAVAPVRPLAWKPPYAMSAALKRPKKKKKRKERKEVLSGPTTVRGGKETEFSKSYNFSRGLI